MVLSLLAPVHFEPKNEEVKKTICSRISPVQSRVCYSRTTTSAPTAGVQLCDPMPKYLGCKVTAYVHTARSHTKGEHKYIPSMNSEVRVCGSKLEAVNVIFGQSERLRDASPVKLVFSKTQLFHFHAVSTTIV